MGQYDDHLKGKGKRGRQTRGRGQKGGRGRQAWRQTGGGSRHSE